MYWLFKENIRQVCGSLKIVLKTMYWFVNRAEIYRKVDDITMAIINYTQAIKVNPQDHEAYFRRAQMYEKVA